MTKRTDNQGIPCLFFDAKTLGEYVLYHLKHPVNSDDYEVVCSLFILAYYNNHERGRKWKVGFPVTSKVLDGYKSAKSRTEETLQSTVEFFKSNKTRNPHTDIDLVIRDEVGDKKLGDYSKHFQIKRHGYRNPSDIKGLIETLIAYKLFAKTNATLLIHLFGESMDFYEIREWFKKNKNFPFREVILMKHYFDESEKVYRVYFIPVHPNDFEYPKQLSEENLIIIRSYMKFGNTTTDFLGDLF